MTRVIAFTLSLVLVSTPVLAVQKSAQTVLCCCRTMGGGQCCAQVSMCGIIVPGCLCSPFHKQNEAKRSGAWNPEGNREACRITK